MAKFSEPTQIIFSILGDRPVAYHPKLAKAVGGVKQAIFICQFLYWNGKGSDPDGWIHKTQAEIEEETGLTRHEQDNVRSSLKANGILEEKLKRVPATVHYRLNLENLYSRIATTYQSSLPESGNLVCGEVANQSEEKRQSLIETENTQENTSPEKKQLDLVDGFLHFAQKANGKKDMAAWPEDIREPAQDFARVFSLPIPESKTARADWMGAIRDIRKDAQGLPLAVIFEEGRQLAEREDWLKGVGRPAALIKSLPRITRNIQNSLNDAPLNLAADGSFYV